MELAPVDGSEAMRLLQQGALLVDIRDGEERARVRIPGSVHASVNQPLPQINDEGLPAVVFHCSCGRRSEDNAYRLRGMTGAPAFMLRGGLDAWVEDGLPVVTHNAMQVVDRHGPALMGALALGGALLAVALGPAFEVIALAVGLR